MSDDEAFLAAIYDAPDDDAPRLIYADWLEEHGQAERAEFIRLQCKYERGESWIPMEDERMSDLEDLYEKTWASHLPQNDRDVWRWSFRRGFPEKLEIEVSELLENYEKWSTMPHVRFLDLCGCTTYFLRDFASRQWNPNWVSLELFEEPKPWLHAYGDNPDTGLAAIALSPQAAQLRVLGFSWYHLGEEAIKALCDSPYLRELAVLKISNRHITDTRLIDRFGAILQADYMRY